MPTIAHHVPMVRPAITSPTADSMQPANRFQRRSFIRSESWPQPTSAIAETP